MQVYGVTIKKLPEAGQKSNEVDKVDGVSSSTAAWRNPNCLLIWLDHCTAFGPCSNRSMTPTSLLVRVESRN